MRPFQPSPIWNVFCRLWSFRFLMAGAIMALCLELVARISPSLVGMQVHQRYLYTSRTSELDDTTLGEQIRWVANGRGARGDLYHGQRTQIAVFGGSTSEDWALDQNRSWAQQLKLKLGRELHHVDNYARNNSYHKEAIVIMKEFARTGRRYDIILFMLGIDRNDRPEVLANSFFYWGRWGGTGSGRIKSLFLLKQRLGVQVRSEVRLRRLYEWVDKLFSTPPPQSRHPRRNARSNRVLRMNGVVQLKYAPWPFDEEDRLIVKMETRRLIEAARSAAHRVFMITRPVAYDENEHPGVSQRWYSLYPINGKDVYRDNRSVAESIRLETAVMAGVAESMGVSVIALDAHMRQQLAGRDDLFFDKWHLTAAGAEVAADFIAAFLKGAAQPGNRTTTGSRWNSRYARGSSMRGLPPSRPWGPS